ncbi:O-fucosyltransferase 7-like isoform X2 [Camellia sinensis]|uniref:O-fucosyltransferase 7-like isoform X2 n=1 Tax=Camellia sinensis TaxID=4442 RepID=UPI001036B204|nr:O-fucosyltransferase 7-like isoform X2 [Camellia sinensis]
MRAGICDMVAVARIINATLVIPELDKRSFWQDTSNFSDVFDQDHFISSLANDVKVIRKLPKELANATRAVKHFRSWSGIDLELVNTKKAISIRRTDWQSLPRS